MTLETLQKIIHDDNVAKGWWEEFDFPLEITRGQDRSVVVEKLCLVHSEISEALEEIRAWRRFTDVRIEEGKPLGFGIELADAIIRILDLGYACGIDLGGLVVMKLEYNRTRAYKHGGKSL